MKILKKAYEHIIVSYSTVPPECGGILGGTNGIITEYYHDNANERESAVYYPDIKILNHQIEKWNMAGKDFYGLAHSHFARERSLSSADRDYISVIMNAVSEFAYELYFPVVIPNCEIISYVARRNNDGKLLILKDTIEILDIDENSEWKDIEYER